MNSSAKAQIAEYLSLAAKTGRNGPRPMWSARPARQAAAQNLGHEAEVMRALTLAVPISLVLWALLIWALVSYF